MIAQVEGTAGRQFMRSVTLIRSAMPKCFSERASRLPAHSLRRGRLQAHPPEPVAVRRQDPLCAAPGGGSLRLPDPPAPLRQVTCWKTTTTASGRTISTPPSPAPTSGRGRRRNTAATSSCASTSGWSTTSSKPWSGSSRATVSSRSGGRCGAIPTCFPMRRCGDILAPPSIARHRGCSRLPRTARSAAQREGVLGHQVFLATLPKLASTRPCRLSVRLPPPAACADRWRRRIVRIPPVPPPRLAPADRCAASPLPW